MSDVQIVNLTTVCQSFPEIAVGCHENVNEIANILIARDNFLDTIDTLFEGGNQLVVVEGDEGIGKTVLSAQFAKRYENNAFCLFIKTTSRLGYDQIALQYDLCNQIEWALNKNLITEPDEASAAYLRTALLKLQQHARWKKQTYYFVIDGIEEIPADSSFIRDWLYELLPFGFSNLKFLITGDLNNVPHNIRKNINCKSMPLSGFTLDETIRYFGDLKIERNVVEEIFRNFKKPGHLASVKRVLSTTSNINGFVNEMPNKLQDLFDIEWKKAEINETQSRILAIMAFDRNHYTVDTISEVLNIDFEEVISHIGQLNFICINPDGNNLTFVSESFRKYVCEKLNYLKDEIYDLLIGYLIKKPNTEEALIRLPDYYAQIGKYNDLVEYLSPENFVKIMSRCQSMGILKQKLDLGITSAYKSDNSCDYIRFSAQKSIINEISNSEVWRSEIETRIAMNDYETALNLAQNSVLKEDRLHSLAVIAKKKREQGLSPEPEIVEQIRQLYNQIDYLTLGDKAIEIASDLIYSNSDLAIELVEKSTNTSEGENSLDWAYTKLALSALSKDSQSRRNDYFEDVNLKISNDGIKGLNSGIKLLIGNYGAAEVISEVQKLDVASNRIFLLRQWLQLNKYREDAIDVIEYAIKLTINAGEYAPNARVFRELVAPLPNIKDTEKVKVLIGLLDSQKDIIEEKGPTEEYVRLQLIISEAEVGYDINAVSNRLTDVFLYSCSIPDLSVKSGCMAWLVAFLFNNDPELKLEKKDSLHTLSVNELNKDVDILLNTTADHYNVTKRVLSALARSNTEMAYDIAMKLNTQNRRDFALHNIIRSAIKGKLDNIDFNFILKMFNNISFDLLRDKCFLEIIDWLNEIEVDIKSFMPKIKPIILYYKDINDATNKCKACSILYVFLKRNGADSPFFEQLESDLLKHLDESWKLVDLGSQKVNLGFKITESLLEYFPDKAMAILKDTEEYKNNFIVNTGASEYTFAASLDLAIRAFGGLLLKKVDRQEDIQNLTRLLDTIPSLKIRAELWSELAMRYYLANRKDDFDKILNRHLKPILRDIKNCDKQVYYTSLCNVAPVLYLSHSLTAHDQISELPFDVRDVAYMRICEFIFRKCSPSDPYEHGANSVYIVSYEEVVNICDILRKMDNDTAIYEVIGNIGESISSRKGFYTQQQRADICSKLKEIIKVKLPNRKYIKHDGYKIIALAQVARLEKSQETVWNSLIDEAEKIDNIADQAYVLCIIAVLMPRSTRQKSVISRAKELVENIPSAYDKADRYETLGQLTWDTDREVSKECFTNAMKFANKSDNNESLRVQRNIIDNTYRLDPELAGSLASLLDNDEARKNNSQKLKHRMEVLKLRKCIEEEDHKIKSSCNLNIEDYGESAWMLLGSLNSSRISPVPLQYTYPYIEASKNLKITESYFLFAWVIENAVKKLNNMNQTSSLLRPIYESMLLSTELALRIAEQSMALSNRNKRVINNLSECQSEIIRPGDRETVINFLLKWFKDKVNGYVKICDPFFGPKDLEILQLIQSVDTKCTVKILTSVKVQEKEKVDKPWQDAYLSYWCSRISDQNPPDTDIVIVGTEKSGELPIHDRWIVTDGSGLRLGTSFNSLGINKYSDISYLSDEEAQMREYEIDQYLSHIKKDHNGDRLKYTHFNL